MAELRDELKIFHGNTICLPEDTQQNWYGERNGDEGGILPEELRNQRFDVIVGNPPYTHLRSLQNRRYAAYPKQRDMAQVFVRWALDHLTHRGVVSFNTTDTWLDTKVSDGAKETRALVNNKIAEIINDESIQRYSEQEGGNIGTMVLCIAKSQYFILNNEQFNHRDTSELQFVKSFDRINLPYRHTEVVRYTDKMSGHRSSFGSHNKFKTMISGNGEYYLASKCIVGAQTARDWMLIQTDDIIQVIEQNVNSEVKYFSLEREKALWLFGFLSSIYGVESTKKTFRDGGRSSKWVRVLSNNMFQSMCVPDFDFYKHSRPERFQAYMDWIESNMRDKDAFLAGIDEQFERLIAKSP